MNLNSDHVDRYQVFHNLLEGCQVIGPDWRYIYVNDTAAKHGHQSKQALIGKTMIEMYPGIETTEMYAHLRRCMYERVPHIMENQFMFPDGTAGWFELRMEPVTEGVFILSLDITERKRLEEQNQRLQRLESVGALAGGIVHDLNNILGPIMLALGALRSRLADPGDHKMIDLLQTNSKRAADLAKQMLTFARGAEAKRSPLRLNLVVNEVLKLIKPTFASNISFKMDIPKNLPAINGDATQIHQILMNLAVNARDAMPQGGTLAFSAEHIAIDEQHSRIFSEAQPGLYVLLKVSDTGTGMSPEVRRRIFDPFFTTKERGKGTGLGLSTVFSIVKAHRGFLNVSSEIGKGTEFTIYFPAVESGESRQAQRELIEAMQGNGEWILLVDDDAVVREVATISLEVGGYKVLTASDGTEAVALFAKYQQDVSLVITDLDMPFMDGTQLLRVLRKMNPGLIIIGSSGTADDVRLQQFDLSEMNAFLSKPYTSEILLRSIYQALNHK